MNKNELDHLRHSAAHLLAAAVLELWPKAKRTIGPAIENGFYYDFDFGGEKIVEEDLIRIEEKMHALVPSWKGFERKEVSAAEAKEFYADNEYKQELINEFAGEGQTLTFYTSGTYTDLCRGGHSEDPSRDLQHFKLLSIAGAYWRGDEKNKMLTRIYGTAWPSEQELAEHLNRLEEAKKRDHRKLGKELDLFVFSDVIGPGMPLFTPRGTAVRNEIVRFSRELNSQIGFEEVHTPNVNKAELFKISGHYDKYKDDMFRVVSHYSEEEFYLKPMNCPQHTQIYASKMRSYKDLPLRFADFANLYRDERPGELSGLTRLRCFSQDDGHCFCREDQIEAEFNAVLGAITKALSIYGLKYSIRLSLRDPHQKEKYLGDDATWEKAEATLAKLLKENKIEFQAVEGEAAFYGPKMDIMATDSLGREWQVSTVQLDLNMAVRFGLTYVDSDGTQKNPIMIHRALIGSPERFMGILIEHYGGAFPLWLAPVQLAIVPVSSKHIEAAKGCAQSFKAAGIRVEIDTADETVGKKVRNSAGQKIPYIAVIGDREAAGDIWTVRVRGQEEQIKMMPEEFKQKILQEIAARS